MGRSWNQSVFMKPLEAGSRLCNDVHAQLQPRSLLRNPARGLANDPRRTWGEIATMKTDQPPAGITFEIHKFSPGQNLLILQEHSRSHSRIRVERANSRRVLLEGGETIIHRTIRMNACEIQRRCFIDGREAAKQEEFPVGLSSDAGHCGSSALAARFYDK